MPFNNLFRYGCDIFLSAHFDRRMNIDERKFNFLELIFGVYYIDEMKNYQMLPVSRGGGHVGCASDDMFTDS